MASADGRPQRYFGKYRGTVLDNEDPRRLGRLKVQAPSLPGMTGSWALPCVPYAGDQVGFYAMPPVGAHVWIEFEGGDLDAPIWAGCFWADGQVPGDPTTPDIKVWKTRYVDMVLDDRDAVGGFRIEVSKDAVGIAPLSLTFDQDGISIDCRSAVRSVIRLQPDQLVIEHPQARITLEADRIVSAVPPGTHTIKADEISAEAPPAKHTVGSSEGVIGAFPPGKVVIDAMGVASEAGGGVTRVMPALVEIQAPLVKIN